MCIRDRYTQLLLKQLEQKVNLHTCVCLMENLMVQRDFFLAEKVCLLYTSRCV